MYVRTKKGDVEVFTWKSTRNFELGVKIEYFTLAYIYTIQFLLCFEHIKMNNLDRDEYLNLRTITRNKRFTLDGG